MFKDWEAQPGVRAALEILDYRSKKLPLADYGGRTTAEQRVGTNVVARALELPEFRRQKGQIGTASYTDVEHDIRDAFDREYNVRWRSSASLTVSRPRTEMMMEGEVEATS